MFLIMLVTVVGEARGQGVEAQFQLLRSLGEEPDELPRGF